MAGAATGIIFLVTKHVFCRDKSMPAAIKRLSRQNYVCRDKAFVTKLNFCCTKLLSRQAHFCRDKRRVLSRETRVCRDKNDTCGTPANDTKYATSLQLCDVTISCVLSLFLVHCHGLEFCTIKSKTYGPCPLPASFPNPAAR